jgi:hypothetical protein
MSDVASKRYVLGWVLVVLALVLFLRLSTAGPIADAGGGGDGTGGARLGESSAAFTIDGAAAESISPGVMASLDLTFTNPHDFAMWVGNLSVTARAVGAPNADDTHPCAVGDFAVDQVSSSFEIRLAARSTSTLRSLGIARATWPRVGMRDRSVNQDGCKGASLTLDYTASGTRDN